uniref:Protein Wnt n=1 Tax=Hofstenia miamia TaxID=442651 RepID=A0A068CJT4_HOFMI|nr:wnt-5 [Hofstenia miamia]
MRSLSVWLFTIILITTLTPCFHCWLQEYFQSGKYNAFTDAASKAFQIAAEECQKQFKYDRWNCANWNEALLRIQTPHFANKQSGFMHAMASAAVSLSIIEECMNGNDECICVNKAKKDTSREIACSPSSQTASIDEIRFGIKVAAHLIDSLEILGNESFIRKINTHNTILGRTTLKRLKQKDCKCQGASGSCTQKVCWYRLPTLSQIGKKLKSKYNRAKKVRSNEHSNTLYKTNNNVAGKMELVYALKSKHGECSNDTHKDRMLGRECFIKPMPSVEVHYQPSRTSCQTLCTSCNLAVEEVTTIVSKRCQCKFEYCCRVKCEICNVTVITSTCSKM